MKIKESSKSIAEVMTLLRRRELVVNKDYQRGSGFWPSNAMTYLVDTVLNEFPIPRLYFFEKIDLESRTSKLEIIDGQQRIKVLEKFFKNEFSLTGYSKKFGGLKFDELPKEAKEKFLGYALPIELVLQASEDEVLEMFRRMNSYTTPLNKQEQRHASYGGDFKWYINRLSEKYDGSFENMGIISQKQILRMQDAELLAEIHILLSTGLVNQSQPQLNDLYKKFDAKFEEIDDYSQAVENALDYIFANFNSLKGTVFFRRHMFFILVAALFHQKGLLKNPPSELPPPNGAYVTNLNEALDAMQMLNFAVEQSDYEGPLKDFVVANSKGTNRFKQRLPMLEFVLRAFNGNL